MPHYALSGPFTLVLHVSVLTNSGNMCNESAAAVSSLLDLVAHLICFRFMLCT